MVDRKALLEQLPRIIARHRRIVAMNKNWTPIDGRVTIQEQHISVLLALLALRDKDVKRLTRKLREASERANLMADKVVEMSFKMHGKEPPSK